MPKKHANEKNKYINFNDVNGIGYFSEPSGGFTFAEGIILSSGDATFGTGPNNGGGGQGSGGGAWPGDDDLTSLLTNPLMELIMPLLLNLILFLYLTS